MECKLIYISDKEYYNLEDNKGNLIATSFPLKDSSIYKLSKQNCDEIFGNINIIELAESWYFSDQKNVLGVNLKLIEGFKAGFNKATELNKDKLFTANDMMQAIITTQVSGVIHNNEDRLELIQTILQERDVEIRCYIGNGDTESDSFKDPLVTNTGIPKLDENGCIVLKRKEK